MRRHLAAAAALGVLLAPAAGAAPRPQMNDPRGDWSTAGQDVLWGRLSSIRGDDGTMIQGELALAAAPTVPGSIYRFTFHIGCHEYSFGLQVPGAEDSRPALNPTQPGMSYWDHCADVPGPDAGYPASAEVKDNVIVWRARYAGQIARGAIVRNFEGLACVSVTCGAGVLATGDVAASTGHYVVGSDLPRR